MKFHTLNENEYIQLLNSLCLNKKIPEDYDYLIKIVADCKYWEQKLIGINYSLSMILEKYLKREIPCESIIDRVYSLENEMDFTVQEMDLGYIKNLIQNHLPDGYEIEECLISSQSEIYE